MLKILFIAIFSLSLQLANAQQLNFIKNFADEQFKNGNYDSALKEYQRLIFFDDGKEFTEAYEQIAKLFFQKQEYNNAIKYFDFAFRATNNDSLKIEYAFKKALCDLKSENFLGALNELYDLPESQSIYFQQKKNIYLGTCFLGLGDYEKSNKSFSENLDQTKINEINSVFKKFEKDRKKFNPNKVELMSLLIPGLGQMYTGHYGSGTNSFVLLSAVTFYAVKSTMAYGYYQGIVILSSWFYRYYIGGYNNARHWAETNIEIKKSDVLNKLLDILNSDHNN